MSFETLTIAVADIRPNPVALRAVNKEGEQYIGLRDSVAQAGLLSTFTVRQRTEVIDGAENAYYELIDGLHRYTVLCELGISKVAVILTDLNDSQVLEAQMMANVHRIDTKPIEYTKQMQRIFSGNPTMTIVDMATRLAKSATWVSQRLGLLKLTNAIQGLVDSEKITVSNAVSLSKLPEAEQVNFVDLAMTQDANEFAPAVVARIKELRKAALEGRDPNAVTEFTPTARMQKFTAVKEEQAEAIIGPALCESTGASTAAEGFALAIAWAINLDPISVAAQRAKVDERAAKVADGKLKRAADRAAKKAQAAQEAAEKAQAELEG